MIIPELRTYVESCILPEYSKLPGHTDVHITQVINRSFNFSKQVPDVDINMVYVVAAYHDLGRLVDDENHHIHSARILQNDKKLREYFTEQQINIMAEAIEDHRASNMNEPRNIYGKIVSSADRNTNIYDMLERVYDHTKSRNLDKSDSDVIEIARKHLREKYSPSGYASKKMYFEDPDFQRVLLQVETVTRYPETFMNIMRSYNRSRNKG